MGCVCECVCVVWCVLCVSVCVCVVAPCMRVLGSGDVRSLQLELETVVTTQNELWGQSSAPLEEGRLSEPRVCAPPPMSARPSLLLPHMFEKRSITL